MEEIEKSCVIPEYDRNGKFMAIVTKVHTSRDIEIILLNG